MLATAEVSECGTARVNRKPTTVHARSLGSLRLALASRTSALSLSSVSTYTRTRVHVLSFRHVVVNQVLSRWTRANKRTPGTRQCKKRAFRARFLHDRSSSRRGEESRSRGSWSRQTGGQVRGGNCKRLISNYAFACRETRRAKPLSRDLSKTEYNSPITSFVRDVLRVMDLDLITLLIIAFKAGKSARIGEKSAVSRSINRPGTTRRREVFEDAPCADAR